ncbi:hypothetical protein ACJX0J_033927, partial [Zea mays]
MVIKLLLSISARGVPVGDLNNEPYVASISDLVEFYDIQEQNNIRELFPYYYYKWSFIDILAYAK